MNSSKFFLSTLIAAAAMTANAYADVVIETPVTFDFNADSLSSVSGASFAVTDASGFNLTISTNGSAFGSGAWETYEPTVSSENPASNLKSITGSNTLFGTDPETLQDFAMDFITAGNSKSNFITITFSGLTGGNAYNIGLLTGLPFEGGGAWNTVTTNNSYKSSTPAVGSQSIVVKNTVTGYDLSRVVADAEGNITLKINGSGSHTAALNALAISSAVAKAYWMGKEGADTWSGSGAEFSNDTYGEYAVFGAGSQHLNVTVSGAVTGTQVDINDAYAYSIDSTSSLTVSSVTVEADEVISSTGFINGTVSASFANDGTVSITKTDVKSGSVAFSGTGTTSITTLNLAGGDATFSGTGTTVGTMNVSADAELNVAGGTLSATTLSASGGTATIKGTGSVAVSEKIELKNGGNVTIGALGEAGPTVSVKQIHVHNADFAGQEALTIRSGVINVSSKDKGKGTSSGVLLGHWPGAGAKGILTLEGGVVNAQDTFTTISWHQPAGELNVKGGVYNTYGLALDGGDNSAVVNLSGGRLNLGKGGIETKAIDAKKFNFSGGTLGTLTAENWSTSQAITLSGTATINTSVYDVKTPDATTTAGSITLGGVISGEGALTKSGAGTLTLTGNNTYSGGTEITGGTVVVGNASALGTGSVKMASGTELQIATSDTVTLGAVNSAESKVGKLSMNSATVKLTLEDALYLENVTIGSSSPTSVAIDFGTSGSITTAKELNFGNATSSDPDTKKYSFSVALSADELGSLAIGNDVTRTLLESTGTNNNQHGIWNVGSNPSNTEFNTIELILKNSGDLLGYTLISDVIVNASNISEIGEGMYGLVFHEGGGNDSVYLFVNAIPEPSAFGLLAGVGALALVASRRRRNRR